MTPRRTGRLLLAGPGLPGTDSARADVVDVCQASSNGTGQPIPSCEVQTMAPVSYGFWETKSWAYYCTGDHPYHWGAEWSGYVSSFNWNQTGYTGIENPFSETPSSFTNWQLFSDPLTVNLACSSQAQPDVQGCQSNGAGPVDDPGCPQANVHTYCSRGPGLLPDLHRKLLERGELRLQRPVRGDLVQPVRRRIDAAPVDPRPGGAGGPAAGVTGSRPPGIAERERSRRAALAGGRPMR